ncbi:MAG: hypothetical protein IT310_00540 [Anaerolineales bacterium]|nr:hypothetical protein [Anaerolineales bacterium]
MHVGILWFDNDAHTMLSVKIQKALDYYKKKFGRTPDLCLVHPSMLEQGQSQVELGRLIIRAYRSILSGHFWIGIEDQK